VNWFWHALWIALVVIPVTLLWMSTVLDVFLRRDMSGWARVGWLVFALALPVFGSLIYLLLRPIGERRELLPARPPLASSKDGTSFT
jgi:hypothetical protein